MITHNHSPTANEQVRGVRVSLRWMLGVQWGANSTVAARVVRELWPRSWATVGVTNSVRVSRILYLEDGRVGEAANRYGVE